MRLLPALAAALMLAVAPASAAEKLSVLLEWFVNPDHLPLIVAKERGIVIDEVTRAAQGDYESLITLSVVTEKQERSVAGTVHDGRPRIVSIKGIDVDADFAPAMVYVSNEDKPGFIGRFASLLGDAGVNIATFALGRDEEGGSAVALVGVDGDVPDSVLAGVQKLPGVKQAKALKF